MSKVKKGKRVIAAAMAVALSIATISTGIVPNSVGLVQATEDVTYTKLANSSVDGFYYQKDENGIIYCVSDKRQVYTSYDDAVKSLGELSRKIFLEKKYLVPFILITSLFALWGFANDITNPMVAVFQTVMEIPASEAALVQFAFYGGYGTMAIPAALFASRYSYKAGILLGLALYAVGAFLFWPAAKYEVFNFFLISLYILTFGLAFLETTANPYILAMGDPQTATRRLNWNPINGMLLET